jgi:hypothetical protein
MNPRHRLLALALATTSPCLAQWTLRTPMTNPERIHGAVWDGTRFMVAGGFGYTATSTDGVRWDKRAIPSNPNLRGLATNGNGLIVALDDAGHSWATTDGVSWTRSDTSLGLNLASLHWTGSRFAAGVEHNVGTVYLQPESVDGLHWGPDSSRIAPGLQPTFVFDSVIEIRLHYALHSRLPGHGWRRCSTGTTQSMYGIAKGQGKWVVVGDSGIILSSSDGATWAKGSIGSASNLKQIAFLDGLWIAVGDSCTIFTSPDAQAWIRRIKPPALRDTYYSGFWRPKIVRDSTRWTVVENVGRGRILSSQDGVQWSVETVPGDAAFGTAAEEETSEMLLSTGKGTLLVRRNGIIAWRQGATDWVVTDQTPRANLQYVVHQNGIWLAAGPQGDSTLAWRSTDGITWSASRLIFKSSYQSTFKGLFAARGLFIASAYADGDAGSLVVSEDGRTWTPSGNCMLGKIADNGQILVGIDPGNFKVYSSEDGRTWTLRKSKAGYYHMNDIAWNGKMFVAVGDRATLWTSTDGIDWIEPEFDEGAAYVQGSLPYIGDLMSVAWNGTTWSIAGATESLVSADGRTWSRSQQHFGKGYARETSWHGGFVTAIRSFDDTFDILVSNDGLQWHHALKAGPRSGANGRFVGFHDLGDTLYAMTTRTSLFRTGDAENWHRERFTGNAIQDMAHSGGLLVAVGDNSNIWTRPTKASDVGVAPRSSAKFPSIVVSGGRLRIPGGASLSADLLDLQGRILSHGSPDASDLVLDLAGRPKGTWALRLREGDRATTRMVAIP